MHQCTVKGYDLWHRPWLEFAQFNQQRPVEEFKVWRPWQLKQLGKDDLQ